MGNDQSRSSAGEEAAQDGPIDYYELLQVDIEATPDEIKRSYRKLALVNHPDKNPHRVEEATKLFADLQQAYEILSDPNERAFYDRHRNMHIETNDDDFYDHVRSGDAAAKDPKSKFNRRRPGDPGVKLEQLMRFFDPKLARKMDDSTEGFFSVYRSLFNVLASDEALHTPEDHVTVHYPPFGDSTTPWAPPPGTTKAERARSVWARDFYVAWGEFTTEKRFEWMGKWDTARGEDRNVRRLMEKENKKMREEHRKEYIDTVRTLVGFIQNRDPRYKAYQAQQAQAKKARHGDPLSRSGTSTPSAREPRVDLEAARKREEERMQAAAAFQEQDWQRVRDPDADDEDVMDEYVEEGDGTGIRLDNGAGGEIFECVACNKEFHTEASWSNHERSKKHKQAVWRMAKEMRAEAAEFGEDDFVTPQDGTPVEDEDSFDEDELVDELEELELLEAEDASLAEATDKLAPPSPEPPSPPKPKVKTKTRGKPQPEPEPESHPEAPEVPEEDGNDSDATPSVAGSKAPELSKREKRRAREAKKKAEEEAQRLAAKEAAKEAKKAAKKGGAPPPPLPKGKAKDDHFVQPKRKGKDKGGKKHEKVVVTQDDVDKVVTEIKAICAKMVDKWAEHWTDLLLRLRGMFLSEGDSVPDLAVLCLGLGKPYSDRTAKIQLALALELAAGLGAGASVIEAFDPVFEEGDKRVLEGLGCTVIEDNLRGAHPISADRPHLVYMPHCSKTLYESFFATNYTPRLGASPPVVLLGNDLVDYLPGFVRYVPGTRTPGTPGTPGTPLRPGTPILSAPGTPGLSGPGTPNEDDFVKPKKKRKNRTPTPRPVEDSVLRRLVPHFDVWAMSELPETNLPGFARAFLSTAFQWLPADKVGEVDWDTPLPPIEWNDDGEVA